MSNTALSCTFLIFLVSGICCFANHIVTDNIAKDYYMAGIELVDIQKNNLNQKEEMLKTLKQINSSIEQLFEVENEE